LDQLANVLALTLFSTALLIALRAFYLCSQTSQGRRYRLCILGMSMGVLALTAIASYAGDNIKDLPVNVNWFKYTAQTVCFLFIILSLVRSSDTYLRRLMYWQIGISLLLLFLFAPIIPSSMPYPALTKSLLGGSRSLICFVVFFIYIGAFISKETRFSLLMSVAFLLLSIGYWLNMPKYMDSHLVLLDAVGDGVRITGLVALLIAIFLG